MYPKYWDAKDALLFNYLEIKAYNPTAVALRQHTVKQVKDNHSYSAKQCLRKIKHLAHYLDFTLSGYYLFPNLKKYQRGQRYLNIRKVGAAVEECASWGDHKLTKCRK